MPTNKKIDTVGHVQCQFSAAAATCCIGSLENIAQRFLGLNKFILHIQYQDVICVQFLCYSIFYSIGGTRSETSIPTRGRRDCANYGYLSPCPGHETPRVECGIYYALYALVNGGGEVRENTCNESVAGAQWTRPP
jgi:hypothetical protein